MSARVKEAAAALMNGGNALAQPQFRLEPHLSTDDNTEPPTATVSQLDARFGGTGYSMYAVPEKKRKPFRRLALFATLTGIFSFGTALGLFASAWLKNNPHYADIAKSAITGRETPPTKVLVAKERSDDIEGHEDAAPVPKPPVESRPANVAAPPVQAPLVKPDEDEPASPPPEPEQKALAKIEPAPEPVKPAVAAPAPKVEEPVAVTATPKETPPASAEAKAAVERPAAATPEKRQFRVGKAPRKLRAERNAQKDGNGEIERIKRQAGQELNSKTAWRKDGRSGRSSMRQNGIARTSTRYVNRRALVIQCAQAPGLIDRERCKWKWCNGMWGKDGCPSYDPPRSMF